MSDDDYFSKGKGPAPADQSNDDSPRDDSPPKTKDTAFMTVGNGTASEHAARLQSMLDVDSGYGGSIMSGEDYAALQASNSWDATLAQDRPQQSGLVHQMWYNAQRATLGRSINKVLDLLSNLQDMNSSWPAHYPTLQRPEAEPTERPTSSSGRPALQHAFSSVGDKHPAQEGPGRHPSLRRSLTSLEEHTAESSRAAETRAIPEPRLVTPQIAQEFSILKLDLKLGSLHQTELVHSLEKSSIASLLDGKIQSSIKHLLSLRERIEDTSSKVLITGDLNAGKSTFCNALLRRKLLPEDQQPCTAIFCEVLDARENSGIEEVHAVHKDAKYSRYDETTYDCYTLKQLEDIVHDNEKYTQCKIYVKDSRTIDESLLNNGVVDIALIDAPGLNSDTTKTTAIFARQEEIDVVVFVVSAANHFTQSAKEFIWAAAAEKAYLFIVVNGYDTIRDKGKAKKKILDQVQGLSPRTHKESNELVHFVSSNAVPVTPGPGDGDDDGDDGGEDKGKGKDVDKIKDFEQLEQSLRRFVLEKRARSKLAPARTYLLNILNDVNSLASVNQEVAKSEIERVIRELEELEPQLEAGKKASAEVRDQIDRNIEDTCKEIYDQTRSELNSAIDHAGSTNYHVPYPGLLGAFQYADELKAAMLSHITDSLARCEEQARQSTSRGVNSIQQLGILHVGNEFENLQFRPDVMFKRKRDALARQVDVPTELTDFVDWSTLMQRQEKFAGTGMALTVAGAVVPRMVGMSTWMDQALTAGRLVGSSNVRQLILPGLLVAAVAVATYVVQQIPNSLPQRLAVKISDQLAEIDYVHANSTRISGIVRRVLYLPADNLRVKLDQTVKELGNKRDETIKTRAESERAARFFGDLVRESEGQRNVVEGVDLDAPPPGA